ncbi:HlyD family secretion protein [Rhodobacter lacus]|uniref:HlyD family secretion protein n=1 Tax=Rhodobacter lacus TaxID=1641972 RepID=A0ABW5A8X2_9RHOB
MFQFFRSPTNYVATLAGIGGVVLVLFAFGLPPFTSAAQTTNDAYVRGKVTFLSPQIAGLIDAVPAQDYQRVKKGDLLVKIDDRIFRQKVAQAQASLEAAQASLANNAQDRVSDEATLASARAKYDIAKQDLATQKAASERFSALFVKGVVTKTTADDAQVAYLAAQTSEQSAAAALKVAEQDLASNGIEKQSLLAAVDGAQAALRLAEIDLENTRITAPEDGTLGEVAARVGQYVSAGTQIGTLVPDIRWVSAAFKETQIAGMTIGQKATFTVDALDNVELHGTIEWFSPATGSEFAVLKSDNATGNFTKITQRLPVRIRIDPDQPLAGRLVPGMSVVVRIDTAGPSSVSAAELPANTISFAPISSAAAATR